METIRKSNKLNDVCYDIRGPVFTEAKRLEDEGFHIHKLNIGNPGIFGFDAPEEVIHDIIINMNNAQGYGESKGLFAARKAIMQYAQQKNIPGVSIEDIFVGNGVSELIVMVMQALLNTGHEVLIPSPDYPLWTAAVTLSGGKAVHYLCDEASEWFPDCRDLEKKISPKTKAIVLINPNNPTGAVYPVEILERIVALARKHQIIIFADEIYDKIIYDNVEHVSIASLADDVLCITLNGLSKAYRAAGFRAGWMIISGDKSHASSYIEGLNMLASMRLCSNVPAQYGIQTSLGGYQSINDLTVPGGRLYEQRNFAYAQITAIPGITCVKPKAALYMFPRLDPTKFAIKDDQKFILDLLLQERVLVVQGTGFNWQKPDHFRIVFLPHKEELGEAIQKIGRFLSTYHQA